MNLLLTGVLMVTIGQPRPPAQPLAPPLLDNAAAWALLPGAPGKGKPLPAWARLLAGPMPHATAAMLRLDGLTRTAPSLHPRLRALIRLAVADANHSDYGRAIALTDLREDTGAGAPDIASLPPQEKLVWDFARQLALEASRTTDAQVKELLATYSESQVVAMVLLVAHGSFQDRLLLTLRPPIEYEGVPAPVLVAFGIKRTQPTKSTGPPKPPAAVTKPGKEPGKNLGPDDPAWTGQSLAQLQESLENQRKRVARIRIPGWKEVQPHLEMDSWVRRWPKVGWGLVAFGHQAEIADAWFDCVDQFRVDGRRKREGAKPEGARLDPMLSADMFWVVTRSLNCFY